VNDLRADMCINVIRGELHVEGAVTVCPVAM